MRAEPPPRRPRLLFLCQTLPFPPDGGVNIRTYHVLRVLATAFDITALCFFRRLDRPSPEKVREGVAGLGALAGVVAFPIPQEHNRLRWIWDHVRSVARRRAYTWYAYASRDFRDCITDLFARHPFDLVHVDSLDLAAYLPALERLPVACTHHNVESKLLRRRADGEAWPWRRRYLAWQATLVEREERRWCPRVALNVAVSAADADDLRRLAPGAPVTVVPNGVDTSYFRPEPGSDRGLVFVGGANWFPNRDALVHFCTDILPHLGRGGPAPVVRWVGRTSEADRARFGAAGVELTGYVDDVRPYVRDAACYVVPLRVGGGTRLKILDAWAMGKAIVSTSVGCEGLDTRDGVNILIRDDPARFASAVRDVLENAELRQRLGREGRATAERRYDWDVVGAGLLASYARLVPQDPS